MLGRLFGAEGIAAGIALGAWSSALALIRRGAATFGFSIDAAARRRLPRIVAAALAMGGLLWLAARFLPMPRRRRAWPRAGRSPDGADIAAQSRFTACFWPCSGVTNWGETVNALRQNRPADLRE